MNIGEKLKEYRIRKGWTQENVAEILDMSVSNYAHIEQGKTKVTTQRLEEIAERLETNVFELLTLGEKNTFYIQENRDNSQNAYIIHNSLPTNYQDLLIASEKLKIENKYFQEKISLLENEIINLKEMIKLVKKS